MFAPLASAQTLQVGENSEITLAQPAVLPEYTIAPGQLSTRVTDTSGVLTPEQNTELGSSIQQLLIEHQKSIFIIYMPSFDGFGNTEWAELAVDANGGGNTFVLAIATEDRQFGLSADTTAGTWSESDLDDIEDAILPSLVESDWPEAGFAAVDAATRSAESSFSWDDFLGEILALAEGDDSSNSTQPEEGLEVEEPVQVEQPVALAEGDDSSNSTQPEEGLEVEEPVQVEQPVANATRTDSTQSGSSFWSTLVSFVTVFSVFILLGVLLVYLFRKVTERRQKYTEQQLVSVRQVAHNNDAGLADYPVHILEKRADELIVTTGALMNRSREELNIAVADFGSLRTRSIQQAAEEADRVFKQALQIHQKITLSNPGITLEEPSSSPRFNTPSGQGGSFLQTIQNLRLRIQRLRLRIQDLRLRIQKLQQNIQSYTRFRESINESNPEKQTDLIQIISLCGRAEEAVNQQRAGLSTLRDLIANAGTELSALTQQSVSLRTRIIRAQASLLDLQSRYAPEMLESINDNVSLAESALEQAEGQLSIGREQNARPAGQRAGVINAIRGAEQALGLIDPLLLGIEHADNNIAAANDGFETLSGEVEEKIQEAQKIKAWGLEHGAEINWETLDSTVANSSESLDRVREQAAVNPLSAYSSLIDTEDLLAQQLEAARESVKLHAHKLQLIDQKLTNTRSQIQIAKDLISSHDAVVKAQARIYLANAMSLVSRATAERTKQISLADELVKQAAQEAQRSTTQTNMDIKDHEEKLQTEQPVALGLRAASFLGLMTNELHQHRQEISTEEKRAEEKRENKRRKREERRRRRAEEIEKAADSSQSTYSPKSTTPRQNVTSSDNRRGNSSRGGSF
ncbi:hypothetical protein GCM10027580_21930 [Corynebacterium faecale]